MTVIIRSITLTKAKKTIMCTDVACVAVFSVSSEREKARAKGKSCERMGRAQKVRNRGRGWS